MYLNFGIINCHLFEGMIQIRNKLNLLYHTREGLGDQNRKEYTTNIPYLFRKKNSDKEKINAEDIFGCIYGDWYIPYPGKLEKPINH